MRIERHERVRASSSTRRLVLGSVAGLAISMAIGTTALTQSSPSAVKIDSGELQGEAADGVVSFKGIPFAAPPVGELRWRPPQPAAKWTGVRQATEFPADCMQGRFGGPPPGATGRAGAPPVQSAAPAPPPPAAAPAAKPPSEDCLYLNVWRPADSSARNLPVMPPGSIARCATRGTMTIPTTPPCSTRVCRRSRPRSPRRNFGAMCQAPISSPRSRRASK